MNRIVTQHNVSIKTKKGNKKHSLTIEMMAKVYYQKQVEEDKKSKK